MPPPSSRTQWRGDSAAAHASPAVCCLRGPAQTCPWQEGCCSLASPLPPGQAMAAPVFANCITSSNYSAAPRAWIFMSGSMSYRITYKPSYMAESLFPHQERKNFDPHLFFSCLSLQVSDPQSFTAINCDPQLLVAICFQLPPSEKSERLPPFFSPPLSDAKCVSKCSQCINSWPCKNSKESIRCPQWRLGEPKPWVALPGKDPQAPLGISPRWGVQVWELQGHASANSAESGGSSHLLTKSLLSCPRAAVPEAGWQQLLSHLSPMRCQLLLMQRVPTGVRGHATLPPQSLYPTLRLTRSRDQA